MKKSERQAIFNLFKELYSQLEEMEDHDFDKIITVGQTQICLLDYEHRIPGLLLLTTDEKLLPSFTAILTLAGHFIDDEPGEILCCDTDMDSYRITIIYDFFHNDYELPMNPILNPTINPLKTVPDEFDTLPIYHLGFILEPLDYHS